MPSPHIDSIQAANKVFVAEAKKIMPSPTEAHKQAVVSRLVNDMEHMPRSNEGKKLILIRVGKLLKRAAYKSLLLSALFTTGFITSAGIITSFVYHDAKRIMLSTPEGVAQLKYYDATRPLRFGIKRTTAYDLTILAGAIAAIYGIKWSGQVERMMKNDARKDKNARKTRKTT